MTRQRAASIRARRGSGRRSAASRRLGAAAGAILLAATVIGAGLVTAPPAVAVTARAQVQYDCNSTPTGHPELARVEPVNIAVEFDVPESVSPGQTLDLRGVFSIQLPASAQELARQYFKTMNAESDSLTFPMTVNGQTQQLTASTFRTGTMSTTIEPQVLSGVISVQAVTVPANTTGNITLDLPHNGAVQSPIDQAPAAFNAALNLTGDTALAPTVTTDMACSAPAGAQLTIASIPVTAPDPTPPPSENPSTSTPSENPSPTTGNTPPAGNDTGANTAPATAADSLPFSDTAFEEAVGLPEEVIAAETAEDGGLQVPTPTPSGVYVPSWIFPVISVIAVMISLSSMAWMRRRIRLLRTSAGL
ncbi:MAG: hypothetical protein ACTMHS_12990 [Micrococcaceae bacterium]